MLAHALGSSVGGLRARGEELLADKAMTLFQEMIRRRAAREPIQYILGTEEFMGLPFHVTPAVLIPRQDTEVLVRQAAALLGDGAKVADIGTGSGAIAVAIAKLLPEAEIVAVDLSTAALQVARANAVLNGVEQRIDFREGDLLMPLAGRRFNAILSNPPYVAADELPGLMPEVRDWEPRLALTPGADGLAMFRRLIQNAGEYLLPGGILGLEVGAGQAVDVSAMLTQAGFKTTVHCDHAGILRAVIGWYE